MSLENFKNFDGTTKSTFKIGTRGITLVPQAVENQEGLARVLKLCLKDHNDDKNIVELLNSGSVEIPKKVCSKIETIDNGEKVKFTIGTYSPKQKTWVQEEIIININPKKNGDITGPDSSVENNFVTFADDTGKTIKDSGLSLESGKINTESNTNNSKIPTISAIIDYIGDINDVLATRLKGDL